MLDSWDAYAPGIVWLSRDEPHPEEASDLNPLHPQLNLDDPKLVLIDVIYAFNEVLVDEIMHDDWREGLDEDCDHELGVFSAKIVHCAISLTFVLKGELRSLKASKYQVETRCGSERDDICNLDQQPGLQSLLFNRKVIVRWRPGEEGQCCDQVEHLD